MYLIPVHKKKLKSIQQHQIYTCTANRLTGEVTIFTGKLSGELPGTRTVNLANHRTVGFAKIDNVKNIHNRE